MGLLLIVVIILLILDRNRMEILLKKVTTELNICFSPPRNSLIAITQFK
tara:strand:+ start:199 stop:345 length:147 start_codon:yes stop_codon:yes gene_type:complete